MRSFRSSLLRVGLAFGLMSTGGALLPLSANAGQSAAEQESAPPEPEGSAVSATSDSVEGSEHRSLSLSPGSSAPGALTTESEGLGVTAQEPLRGTLDVPTGVTVVGVRWTGAGEAVASLRVHDGTSWGPWETLGEPVQEGMGQDAATGQDAHDWATEGTLVIDANQVQVQVDGAVDDASLDTWSTAVTNDDLAQVNAVPPTTTGPSGIIVGTRAQWAGSIDLIPGTAPIRDSPKLGVTVHHTATSAYYTPEQVPAMLRSIYQYHARTLGWGDIGYNMLVDRHGRLWEGRSGGLEQNVQGAHAFGMNSDWFGLSVLGDHSVSTVPTAEFQALNSATGWVLNLHGAEADGEVRYTNQSLGWTRWMPTIHGHGDVDSTACPGYHLHGLLDVARQVVGNEQQLERTAVQRISGGNRYGSAAALAQEANLWGVDTAYLTQGLEIADALGVGPVASGNDAAVLLSRKESVPTETWNALEEMGAEEVVVVGGEEAITKKVRDSIIDRGYDVRRVEGGDRYRTAVQLSYEREWESGTVYLASGTSIVDALGGAAAAAEVEAPMLLTRATGLPGPTLNRLVELDPARVVVLGGTEAVKTSVLKDLEELLPRATVDRIGGGDRYLTSALIAQDAFDQADSAVLAAGTSPVDAMAGTQLAANHGGPVLLVRKGCLPGSVNATYDALGTSLSRLAGGTLVLGQKAGWSQC